MSFLISFISTTHNYCMVSCNGIIREHRIHSFDVSKIDRFNFRRIVSSYPVFKGTEESCRVTWWTTGYFVKRRFVYWGMGCS
jgi:hypothetical protein